MLLVLLADCGCSYCKIYEHVGAARKGEGGEKGEERRGEEERKG